MRGNEFVPGQGAIVIGIHPVELRADPRRAVCRIKLAVMVGIHPVEHRARTGFGIGAGNGLVPHRAAHVAVLHRLLGDGTAGCDKGQCGCAKRQGQLFHVHLSVQ